MKTITVRLRAPDDLSTATLARALNDLGCWVEAVPQNGTRKSWRESAPVIPLSARSSTAPNLAPEGI
jgi:hypothetical protein